MNQIHVRGAETAALLREAARQTGRTITEVLREAVRAYVPVRHPAPKQVDPCRLLARDHEQLVEKPGAVDDPYDADGLPR